MKLRLPSVLAGLALIFITLAGHADTITVNFTQGGFVPADPYHPGYTGSLTGTFTGSLDSDGTLKSGGLSNFSVALTILVPDPAQDPWIVTYDLTSLGFAAGSVFTEPFFFDPSGGASSLSFEVSSATAFTPSRLCVGVDAAFDPSCQRYNFTNGSVTGGYQQPNFGLYSPQNVVITSIVRVDVPVLGPDDPPTGDPTPTPTAVTPEPSSILLFATGLGGVASVLRRRIANRIASTSI
ncbi:hypothetical protein BH10ACI4_BH10ACI4_26280 [soil metagenome]